MKLCALFLTCANDKEADAISTTLLKNKLVFCVKKFPVQSSFLWEGSIESSDEVLLFMDSIEENFEKVHVEVKKLHSYDTFVLLSIPIQKTTKDVESWVKNELKSN